MSNQSGILVNGRCYLTPLVATIQKLKEKMTRKHWDILWQTPFPHFMDIELVVQEQVVIGALMQAFDEKTKIFKLGESYL